MILKQWVGVAASSLCISSCVFAQFSGASTASSADGKVQVRTESPSGKVTVLRPTEMEMKFIRERAEAGEAASQMILSQVEYWLKNRTESERWLRQAAQTGNIFAAYTLGFRLVFDRSIGPTRPDEGIVWVKLAAYEGYPGAQSDLATCYRKGLGVQKDDLEAYVWFLISNRNPIQGDAGMVAKLLVAFEGPLNSAQIEEGKLRAKKYVPTVMERNPFVDAGFIKLNAISESKGKPIVLINGQAFTTGEQKKVKWITSDIEVRCLEIRTNSVIIAAEPYWQRGEMQPSE